MIYGEEEIFIQAFIPHDAGRAFTPVFGLRSFSEGG
jgi:hypothetical protein